MPQTWVFVRFVFVAKPSFFSLHRTNHCCDEANARMDTHLSRLMSGRPPVRWRPPWVKTLEPSPLVTAKNASKTAFIPTQCPH